MDKMSNLRTRNSHLNEMIHAMLPAKMLLYSPITTKPMQYGNERSFPQRGFALVMGE